MFGKDSALRIRDTLEFLGQNTAIRAAAEARLNNYNRAEVSRRISLGARDESGPKDPVETERRRALRGFLLCLYVSGLSAQVEGAKEHYGLKTQAVLLDAINSCFPIAGAGADQVINAAVQVHPPLAGIDTNAMYKYRRGAVLRGDVTGGGNCYQGVAQWLYLGGVVSLAWLHQHGSMSGDAMPQPEFEWWQRVTAPADAALIPPGRVVFMSRRAGARCTVHYALSIRPGVCVGINNPLEVSQNWAGAGPAPSPGYSEFRVADYLTTCQNLYAAAAPNHAAPNQAASNHYVFVRYAHCTPPGAF